MRKILAAAVLAAPLATTMPALAAPAKFGDPVKVGDEVTLDPILDARLRWEHVDQPTSEADAVTLRLRAGAEVKHLPSHLALLVEAEGVLGIGQRYNAYPGNLGLTNPPASQLRPAWSVVADPENVELNRLQLQYKTKQVTATLGRQRINLDDQRFVGAVGWRQNEQTFDAVRGEAAIGPVSLDATYAISQRTVFGYEAGQRTAYDGRFGFVGLGGKIGPVQLKGFAYLLDYDLKETAGAPAALAKQLADSQTYGLRAVGQFKLSRQVGLGITASYARQSALADNPLDFAADYILGEANLTYAGFTLTGGWEKLGSAATVAGRRAVQTPMATLHKFNGWADLFLVTPDNGLQDAYVGLAYKFAQVKAIPGLNAQVAWHRYDSDFGDLEYGTEWNAQLGLKLGLVALLAKYAEFNSRNAAFVSTRKVWLQAEYAF
ncbi:MAG: alginate export family protein [Novosphingobium sp.]